MVVASLWKRPDLSRDDCARLVKETVVTLLALAGEVELTGLVWDLHEGPASWGPITHKALVDGIGAWDTARKSVAVLPAPEAIARITACALVAEAAPRNGRLTSTIEEALLHAKGPKGPPTSPPAGRT